MRFRRRAAGLVVALGAGCGTGAPPGDQTTDHPATTFELTHVPDDRPYELALAARGTTRGLWGDDFSGSDEPLVVLGEPGLEDPTTGRLVVVSATGYEGYEGGFGQASAGYSYQGGGEQVRVDGRPGIYTPAGEGRDGRPADDDLVVDHGGGTAVRVRGPGADRATLLDVARRTEVVDDPDGTARPVVEEPPEGLAVLSAASIDLIVALQGYLADPRLDRVPGTSRSFSVGYRVPGVGERPWILAVSVPGSEDDLVAAGHVRLGGDVEIDPVEVSGRPGLLVVNRYDGGAGGENRRVLTTGVDGSLLVVRAEPELATEELVAVAAGARPVDASDWERQRALARGEPGLRADPGAVEVTRGRAEELEWLLQAVPSAEVDPLAGGSPSPIGVAPGALVIDTCLKLSDSRHACEEGATIGTDASVHTNRGNTRDGGRAPPFVYGVVPADVVEVKVATRVATTTVETVEIPGGSLRAFVAVVEGAGFVGRDLDAPASIDPTTVDLVHADGTVTRAGSP